MKDLNYYLALKYPVELVETDEGVIVSHPDLPGCQSFGDNLDDALKSLAEVRELWLQGYFDAHGTAPEPKELDEYSGKFVVRLPKSLHRALERVSQREGTSLNQLVVALLSQAVAESDLSSRYSQVADRLEQVTQHLSALVTSSD